MELACHPSGTQNFEVAPRYLEILCYLVLTRWKVCIVAHEPDK